MSIVRKTYDFLDKYFTILIPQKIEKQPKWDGICITPIHNEKKDMIKPIDEGDEYCITPIHETSTKKGQTITRAFGDLLAEEMM